MILVILRLKILQKSQIESWRKNVLVLLGAGLIGILSEIIQIAVPGRYGSLSDIGFNSIGTIASLLISSYVNKTCPSGKPV